MMGSQSRSSSSNTSQAVSIARDSQLEKLKIDRQVRLQVGNSGSEKNLNCIDSEGKSCERKGRKILLKGGNTAWRKESQFGRK